MEQRDSTQATDPLQSCRKKCRLQQSQRNSEKGTRGTTKGVKWKNERSQKLGSKPSFKITSDMERIVGENADQFITEAGILVRTTLPLNCRGWKDMDDDPKQRLFNKIKADCELPKDDKVHQAVKKQCQALYRQWRYRLKEKHFDGFSVVEALSNAPPEVNPDHWKWIVQNYWGSDRHKRVIRANKANRSKQQLKAVQGPKSTARILDMLRKNHQSENTSERSEQTTNTEGNEASQAATAGISELPPPQTEYIRLFEMTKRHKDNSWDKLAEQRLEEFKELHEQQLALYGIDNLTVQEAYMKVLGTTSGYINGLGFGPKPPKGTKEGRSNGEGIEAAYQMAQQLEQLDTNSREREARLQERLEKDSREREAQLQERLEKDSRAREDELKKEIQSLQDGKVELLREMEKLKQDAAAREERMFEQLRSMQETMMRSMSPSGH